MQMIINECSWHVTNIFLASFDCDLKFGNDQNQFLFTRYSELNGESMVLFTNTTTTMQMICTVINTPISHGKENEQSQADSQGEQTVWDLFSASAARVESISVPIGSLACH
jgi:hypothetical protein